MRWTRWKIPCAHEFNPYDPPWMRYRRCVKCKATVDTKTYPTTPPSEGGQA